MGSMTREEQQEFIRKVVNEMHQGHERERNAVIMSLGQSVQAEDFLASLQSSYIVNLRWTVELMQKNTPETNRRSFTQYLRDLADTIDQMEKVAKKP